MVWCVLIILVFFVVSVRVLFILYSKVAARKELLTKNLQVLELEISTKENLLCEFASLSTGFSPVADLEKAKVLIAEREEKLKTEKGRFAITNAELDAIDIRLRELEEISRELENSGIEAANELEMLRGQEKAVKEKNAALRAQLEESMFQLDLLLDQLTSSQGASETLNKVKSEVLDTQNKNEFYEEQISVLNRSYMDLKRAYDALDIEYAQLYEKQSMM